MALVLEATASGRGGGGIFINFNLTIPAGLSNSILLVGTSVQDSNHANIGVAALLWGVSNLTKIRFDEAVGNNRTEWWYRKLPASGTNTIEIDTDGTVGEIAGFAFVFSGADQTTIPDAQGGITGNAQNPSLSITTVTNNAYILSMLSTEATISAGGTGQTLYGPLVDQSFENAAASTKQLATAGLDTQSFTTGSAQSYALSIVSVKEFIAASVAVINTWKRTGRPRPFAPGNAR